MKSGKLRYPSKVVREVTTRTTSGAESVEYKDILETRADIQTVSGREYIEGGAETMETTVKIVIRKPVDTDQRVLMGDLILSQNREYKIISVLEFDKNRSLQLMCKEIL